MWFTLNRIASLTLRCPSPLSSLGRCVLLGSLAGRAWEGQCFLVQHLGQNCSKLNSLFLIRGYKKCAEPCPQHSEHHPPAPCPSLWLSHPSASLQTHLPWDWERLLPSYIPVVVLGVTAQDDFLPLESQGKSAGRAPTKCPAQEQDFGGTVTDHSGLGSTN